MALLAFEEHAPSLAPPLKWAGGKRWLLPHVRPLWQMHAQRRLVEPFVGGLAVVLGLRPKTALLNDANPHLVNFYQWLQRGLDIARTGVETVNDRGVYLRHRARFNELIRDAHCDSAEAAAIFYYLNRTGYNGLCRFNSSGFFNVPFGRYKTITYRREFSAYREILDPYRFTAGDFSALDVTEEDFIYADPPYDVEFTSYAAGGFSWNDQVRLAEWLARHSGPVVASNQATSRIRKLYRSLGFRVSLLDAPRRISCDGNRDDAKEMLATKGIP